MDWCFPSWKSLCRPSWETRRSPKRERLLTLEGLETRLLPSKAIQSLVTVPELTSNVISGPRGYLWVGAQTNSDNPTAAIDRIGLNGSVTTFPVPSPENSTDAYLINSLTTGPDGNLWFIADPPAAIGTNNYDNQIVIGNMTPAGVVTEFPPIPLPSGQSASARSIISGPGGDLWFAYSVMTSQFQNQNFIGQVTTSGAVELFPIASSGANPIIFSLAAGADGSLWFTESAWPTISALGQFSPSGAVTFSTIPGVTGRRSKTGQTAASSWPAKTLGAGTKFSNCRPRRSCRVINSPAPLRAHSRLIWVRRMDRSGSRINQDSQSAGSRQTAWPKLIT